MKVKTFVAGPIDANNYLIYDEKSHEAALIDCSDYLEEIVNIVRDYNLNLKYILLTHGHFDHVAGIRKTEAKIVMNKNDLGILKQANNILPTFGISPIEIHQVDIFVNEGDTVKLGKTELKVIHTPGHTQGGVCYLTYL